jgi:hypothetical protein
MQWYVQEQDGRRLVLRLPAEEKEAADQWMSAIQKVIKYSNPSRVRLLCGTNFQLFHAISL